MTFPYSLLFVGLLAAALILLVAAAIADAVGSVAAANAFAEYVFFLLAAGVVLLLVDHLRAGRVAGEADRRSAGSVPPVGPSAQPANERQRPPNQPLDRPEQ
jgi:hypothetical protein